MDGRRATRGLGPDLLAARFRRLVLLALAVAVVLPMLVANHVTGLVSGVASVGLVLLGLSPTRRWHPRSTSLAWTERAGHLGDEMSLTADGTILWSMDTASGLAGAIPVGPEPYRVDRLDIDADALQLSHRGVRPVHVDGRAWGSSAFDRLTARLAEITGLRVRERAVDGREDDAFASLMVPHRPASLGVDLVFAVVLASISVVTGLASVAVAVPYGLAAMAAAGLAVELVVAGSAARRRRLGPTP